MNNTLVKSEYHFHLSEFFNQKYKITQFLIFSLVFQTVTNYLQ